MMVHFKFLQLLLCESLNIFFLYISVSQSVFSPPGSVNILEQSDMIIKKKKKNSQHHFSVRTVMNPEVTDIKKKKYFVYDVYFGNTFTLKLTNKDCFSMFYLNVLVDMQQSICLDSVGIDIVQPYFWSFSGSLDIHMCCLSAH